MAYLIFLSYIFLFGPRNDDQSRRASALAHVDARKVSEDRRRRAGATDSEVDHSPNRFS